MLTEHEELVRDVYDAYARRDLAAALSRFSPEVEFVQTDLLPWGGRYQGIEGAKASLGKLLAHVDSRVEIEEIISAGDHVVVVARTRGMARSSGAAFDIRAVHVWTVSEGSIRRFEAYIDTPAMLSALAPGEALGAAIREGHNGRDATPEAAGGDQQGDVSGGTLLDD